MDTDTVMITEMRNLLRHKMNRIVMCIENSRTFSLREDIDSTMEMLSQLSSLINIDAVVDAFRVGVSFIGESLNLPVGSNFQPSTNRSTSGRPSFYIPQEIIVYFLDHDFKIPDIAKMLNVSISTIKRRLKEYDISVYETYSQISDDELIDMIKSIQKEFPDAGYNTIRSIVKSKGHKVQRQRIRHTVKAVDPEGVLFRRLFLSVNRIHRRTYSVRAPRSLWHIDGNHKLIRYLNILLFVLVVWHI